ncbi:MAG TPA: diadenylate cyclase [Myxococcota bacterium]|nr:diadenylate cyclase [Myxococcota bacterium]
MDALLRNLHPVDALDVAIVALLLYTAMSWLRRSHAALAVVGLSLLGAVYLGARLLELHLTTRVFQACFAVGALALVVIFQDELRRGFEELAAFALAKRGDRRSRLDTPELLARALADLAGARIGALVVVAGTQRLDRHLQGGHELGGRLSHALLASLFDPHSPGHDGAVVVEDRDVSRFGVHLPLARGTAALRGLGTRHSAALGLSERSDALCLVVSEERGSVSAARDGELRVIGSEDELAKLVTSFYRERRALGRPRPRLHDLVRGRHWEKLAAVALAIGLWLMLGRDLHR